MIGKRDNGFTIVELIVTIVILAILTTIVTVRLVTTEASGQDQERKIDASAIAGGLEVYYENGSPDGSIPKGYYPGFLQIQSARATSPPFQGFLEGVSPTSIQAPGTELYDSFYMHMAGGTNPDGSYTDAQARNFLNDFPYLYQPLNRSNTYCFTYTECVKFNLYYMQKVSDTVVRIRSKNQ